MPSSVCVVSFYLSIVERSLDNILVVLVESLGPECLHVGEKIWRKRQYCFCPVSTCARSNQTLEAWREACGAQLGGISALASGRSSRAAAKPVGDGSPTRRTVEIQ